MKTLKPYRLTVATRILETTSPQLALSVAAMVPLGTEGLCTEPELWALVGEEVNPSPLDEWLPKPHAEVLCSARAFAPSEDTSAMRVRLRLGTIDKSIYVLGERHWHSNEPTAPATFASIPLSWPHAFGGPSFAANPDGKGLATTADGLRALPNLERPDAVIASPGDRPEPIALGPLPYTAPQRRQWLGSYGDRWLRERYPARPDDFDERFYMLAQPDQWLDGHLGGDESFCIEGMHPTKPRLEGRLPGLAAKCLLRRSDQGDDAMEAHAMRLDTVWLIPHRERAILIFRAVVPATEWDGSDIAVLMAALERAGEPKPHEHYLTAMNQRLDREQGGLHMLRDADLLPAGYPVELPGKDTQATVHTDTLAEAMRRRLDREREALRAALQSHGLDADLPPSVEPRDEPLPAPAELASYVTRKAAEAEAHEQRAEAKRRQAEQQARALCEEHGLDFDTMMQPPAGPPSFSAEAELADLRRLAQLGRAQGTPAAEIEAMLADPSYAAMLHGAERQLLESYRLGAHLGPAAKSLDPQHRRAVRDEVMKRHRSGAGLKDADLTGADLSDLDLTGAQLCGGMLEMVNLNGCKLGAADLSNAVLARASLQDADLSGADLSGANLGKARLQRATLTGACLRRAILSESQLAGARLQSAELEGAEFYQLSLVETDLSSARLSGAMFVETDLTGASFRGADLTKASFVECELRDAVFDEAQLTGTNFVGIRGRHTSFRHARGEGMRAVNGCQLSGARFDHAKLPRACLHGADLTEASLAGACLDGAELGEAMLAGADCKGLCARESMWIRADLTGACMRGADLLSALLSDANIAGTDFSGANLFRVDLGRATGDQDTQLSGANLRHIRHIKPTGGLVTY